MQADTHAINTPLVGAAIEVLQPDVLQERPEALAHDTYRELALYCLSQNLAVTFIDKHGVEEFFTPCDLLKAVMFAGTTKRLRR